jgi:dimethylamine monooxygenase subunit A
MPRDWTRLFPDADHRWTMGLRPTDSAASFFADADSTGAMRAERGRWLGTAPALYAVLRPDGVGALRDTVELARGLGTVVDTAASPWDQLLSLGRAWEPDFVWMHPDAGGVLRLVGGVVCFPSVWSVHEKLGRRIDEIHGPVPTLNDTLGRQIGTFLTKLAPGSVWQRSNWGLSGDSDLNHHPARNWRRLVEGTPTDQIWLRLEHQLLLRLPGSGSVLFGIRLELIPLAEVLADSEAAARFAHNLRTMSEAVAAYKGILPVRPALLRAINHG